MDRLEALTELGHHDHGFLSEAEAERIAAPFGIKPAVYTARDSRQNIKGLFLNTGPGTKAKGIGAHELAEQIAESLGCEWYRAMGRGSALRNAIAAAREKVLSDDGFSTTMGLPNA